MAIIVVSGNAAGFAQYIEAGQHRLAADEPEVVGGTDTGPSPYDLLLPALGPCTSMTLTMARQKQWPLERVSGDSSPARSTLRIARSARPRKACLIGLSGRSA
jgi:uncharacterized OsmC-like protein